MIKVRLTLLMVLSAMIMSSCAVGENPAVYVPGPNMTMNIKKKHDFSVTLNASFEELPGPGPNIYAAGAITDNLLVTFSASRINRIQNPNSIKTYQNKIVYNTTEFGFGTYYPYDNFSILAGIGGGAVENTEPVDFCFITCGNTISVEGKFTKLFIEGSYSFPKDMTRKRKEEVGISLRLVMIRYSQYKKFDFNINETVFFKGNNLTNLFIESVLTRRKSYQRLFFGIHGGLSLPLIVEKEIGYLILFASFEIGFKGGKK